MKTVKLICFTGTGGTRRIAALLAGSLGKRGCEVETLHLEASAIKAAKRAGTYTDMAFDLIVVLFPVHAFDAPEPIYTWAKALPDKQSVPVALVSVSAAGELWINQACRSGLVKVLSRKGCDVFYERTVIMPINIIIATKEAFSARLLELLPVKTENMAGELLAHRRRLTVPPPQSRLLTWVSKVQKKVAKLFGKELRVKEACTGCGLCAKNCPAANIHMSAGTPQFGWHCVQCLRCVYACPANAIYPLVSRFLIVRGGYDLNKIEAYAYDTVPETDEEIASGSYAFFREYLTNEEA